MAGERTPDNPPGRGNDDHISLREHLQRQLDSIHVLLDERKAYFERVIAESRKQLDERDSHQHEALAIALATHDEALKTALVAVEKSVAKDIAEVQNAIRSSRRETDIAYQASQLAIQKSEESINQRLSLLNEFQAKAIDQNQRFAQRETVDARLAEVDKKLDSVKSEALPRETFDGMMTSWVEWRRTVDINLAQDRGGNEHQSKAKETALRWQIAFAGFAVTAAVVLTNILTSK